MLALEGAPSARQSGIKLVQAVFSLLNESEPTLDKVRAQMATSELWRFDTELHEAASSWQRLQFRQLFRLSLESLLSWIVEFLSFGDARTEDISAQFVARLRQNGQAGEMDVASFTAMVGKGRNPAIELAKLESSIRENPEESITSLEDAIASGLFSSLIDGPRSSPIHEQSDRLPMSRAIKEFDNWHQLPLNEFFSNVIEHWILAPHAYWSVSRGLADARAHGKRILRLRIVMGDDGWTLARPDSGGVRPNPTPDRLETVISLLRECDQL
jgi:hypothetical protein